MSANDSGKAFEAVIHSLIEGKGYAFTTQATLPAKSIFGKRIRVDVLIDICDRFPDGLIIECKWQDVTGTAEEKLPYLVENIKRFYACPTVIVIDGHGFSRGAIRWVNNQVDGDRLLAVFSIKEFISWCNREL